jgi:hypothetical protein
MQTPEVVWWGGQRGSWCHGIVEWLTQGFTHRISVKEVQGAGAIVVMKADYDFKGHSLSEEVGNLEWSILMITANEEGRLPIHESPSHRHRVWLQTPHRHQTADHYLPWGWTPNCSVEVHSKKDLDCSFAGQVTHRRRWDLMRGFADVAIANKKWEFHGSDGFAKGISQADYYTLLGRTKVVPCPSGPFTVDSFRVCEALQLGAVPIVDAQSPQGPYIEYWERVFGDHPLWAAYEWGIDLNVTMNMVLDNWEKTATEVSAWWQRYKAGLQAKLMLDLHELGAL